MKILCIGPQFSGSNAAALFKAFSRLGHLVSIVDEFYYVPLQNTTKVTKLISKVFRPLYVSSYNNVIISRFYTFTPDLVLVYKGAFVKPETVHQMQNTVNVVCFYPDVSFHTHGGLLHKTLPLYSKVFTTKTFGIKDMEEQLGQKNGVFIPHGFDPEVHRKLDVNSSLTKAYACDASFIGTWSPSKEKYLSKLMEAIPHLNLKIWGNQWERAGASLQNQIQYSAIEGDLYALAIQASKINIALLSEQVKGASSGDKITSRTFHIPASGGFMLHQFSDEIDEYFIPEEEMVLFRDAEDLINLIGYYLVEDDKREAILERGFKRALRDHSIDNRASQVLTII